MQPRQSIGLIASLLAGLVGVVLIVYAAAVPESAVPTCTLVATTLPALSATAVSTARPTKDRTLLASDSATPPAPAEIAVSSASSEAYLAYVQDGDLVVLVGDGSKSVIAKGTVSPVGPWWSPNGALLLYVTEDEESTGAGYYVWDSAQDRVIHIQEVAPDFPADIVEPMESPWAPSGTRLLFQVTKTAGATNAIGYWVVDLSSGDSWLAVQRGTYRRARWLQDNVLLVTQTREDGLADINLVRAEPDVVSSTVALTQTTGAYVLSPDKTHLAAQVAFPGAEDRGWLQVVPLPAESEPAPLAGSVNGLACHSVPLWSPSGRWISCSTTDASSDDVTGGSTLIVDVNGFSALRIVDGFQALLWSPDGRLLAGNLCRADGCGLVVVDALTGQTTTLSAERIPKPRLAWSPGGVYLAYSLVAQGEMQSLIVWERTTRERQVVLKSESGGTYSDLAWTGDGCRLSAAERETTADGVGPVTALWVVGPDFRQHWQVAPANRSTTGTPAPCPASILENRRFVAFYGSPAGPGLGILGNHDISTTLRLLEKQGQAYRELDPAVETSLAFHMVTTVSDPFPGQDGSYSHRVPHEIVQRWIDTITSLGGWAIISERADCARSRIHNGAGPDTGTADRTDVGHRYQSYPGPARPAGSSYWAPQGSHCASV